MRLNSRALPPGSTSGFTLVELVTVILILGVLVVGVSSFVIFGTRIFVESSSVDRVLSQSRFAMERLIREIRSAVPGSVRLRTEAGYQCLEWLPIAASSSYLDMPFKPGAKAEVGTGIATTASVAAGQLLLIYPLTPADVYADPAASQGKMFSLKAVQRSGDSWNFTFTQKIRFDEASPRQRFYVASGPVSYCIFHGGSNDGDMLRYTGYGINHPSQLAPPDMGTGVLMAQGIVNDFSQPAQLPIELTPATLVNNALVQLRPRFAINGESFQYQHQVQVINVP
ncbi:prepilin-type N-terminal cleavage/methylation domain-containing protein [Shewanella sp. AS16]|uniref:PilW family protein n=1 Tax=Shewanella sp. AS16 TaxID=2907625 RepID=UPI001F287C47|nr:prepilin-type N-terminal cleavage/methylation domain-containing protein [Shewanella sp. AS16]MCE9685912.1 prepilin-type N-terminal cleavage/methylation domain-containing protein [Shewanella sp. AS16]